ncbi:MAG TPA: hypothetical protein VFQ23_01860 [Anaerolineales bacterium]|nr:hypothetical protein [Anaerolineales bacterium]
MQSAIRLLILSALFLSGCNAAATPTPAPIPSSTQTSEPVALPTSTPAILSADPTPTHLPNAIPTDQLDKSIFQFYEGNPVIQLSNNPGWDNRYIDPGAMIYHDGKFHMFFNGINGFPAPVGVGYATSPDGYQWTRQVSEPVLSATALSDSNLLGSNLFVTSALVEPDGTWILYFYTLAGRTFNDPGEIGRATAPAAAGPWTIDRDPILSPGPDGSWDEVQVTAPDVLKTDTGYLMYYDARGERNVSMIGLATSSDGVHWQKYNDSVTSDPVFAESDPVLTVSNDGWDSKRVIDPNVIQTSDGFEMIYLATSGSGKFTAGEFSFGAATSPDGIEWTKSNLNPVLSNQDHSQWSQAFLASLLHVEETYFLYFDFVTPATSGTNIYLATYTGSLR